MLLHIEIEKMRFSRKRPRHRSSARRSWAQWGSAYGSHSRHKGTGTWQRRADGGLPPWIAKSSGKSPAKVERRPTPRVARTSSLPIKPAKREEKEDAPLTHA